MPTILFYVARIENPGFKSPVAIEVSGATPQSALKIAINRARNRANWHDHRIDMLTADQALDLCNAVTQSNCGSYSVQHPNGYKFTVERKTDAA